MTMITIPGRPASSSSVLSTGDSVLVNSGDTHVHEAGAGAGDLDGRSVTDACSTDAAGRGPAAGPRDRGAAGGDGAGEATDA